MIKKFIFKFIRIFHLTFFKKLYFPNNIALYFHNIEEEEFPVLVNIIKYFKKLGYDISSSSLNRNIEGKKLFLSFDDNYYNWLSIAKILHINDCVGIFYTNTGPLRDRANNTEIVNFYERIKYFKNTNSLSTEELRKIHSEYGQVIAGHTTFHYNLNKIPLSQAKKEILDNKNVLEDIIGEKIIHFSYPFGMRKYFNENLRKYCKNIGYETISNAIPGLLYKKYDKFDINRTMWDFNKSFKKNCNHSSNSTASSWPIYYA